MTESLSFTREQKQVAVALNLVVLADEDELGPGDIRFLYFLGIHLTYDLEFEHQQESLLSPDRFEKVLASLSDQKRLWIASTLQVAVIIATSQSSKLNRQTTAEAITIEKLGITSTSTPKQLANKLRVEFQSSADIEEKYQEMVKNEEKSRQIIQVVDELEDEDDWEDVEIDDDLFSQLLPYFKLDKIDYFIFRDNYHVVTGEFLNLLEELIWQQSNKDLNCCTSTLKKIVDDYRGYLSIFSPTFLAAYPEAALPLFQKIGASNKPLSFFKKASLETHLRLREICMKGKDFKKFEASIAEQPNIVLSHIWQL